MPLRADYREARRNLVLASSILLAQQATGVKLPGQPGSPIPLDFGVVHLEIPDIGISSVIPYALALLTVYFSYRLNLEWRDTVCPDDKSLLARFDYRGTSLFALVAVQTFCLKEMWKASNVFYFSLTVVLLSGIGLFLVVRSRMSRPARGDAENQRLWVIVTALLGVCSPIAVALHVSQYGEKHFQFFAALLLSLVSLSQMPVQRARRPVAEDNSTSQRADSSLSSAASKTS